MWRCGGIWSRPSRQTSSSPACASTTSADDASNEAGITRRYGGIHFQDGDLFARQAGAQVGQQAYSHAELVWNPFGETRSRINALVADGEVTTSAARQLVAAYTSASRSFAAGQGPGCSGLDRVGTFLDRLTNRGDVSASAAESIGTDLTTVQRLLCEA